MAHPFSHASAQPIIERVGLLFRERARARGDHHIIFVCGGPVPSDPPTVRAQFIRYAQADLKEYRVVLAETAARDYLGHAEPQFLNIADYEAQLAEIADCVLVFLEGYGAFAEIGYFAAIDRIAGNVLVANNIEHQAAGSFVNRGPVAHVDQKSIFKPTLQLTYLAPDFAPIRERLHTLLKYKTAAKIKPSDGAFSAQQKLYFIYELILLFRPLSIDGLQYLLAATLGADDTVETKRLVSFLIGAGYVCRVGEDEDHLGVVDENHSFIVFKDMTKGVRLDVVQLYQKVAPDVLELLA